MLRPKQRFNYVIYIKSYWRLLNKRHLLRTKK